MKRKLKLNIKKNTFFKFKYRKIKKFSKFDILEKSKINSNMKGNLHKLYVNYNLFYFLLKHKNIFNKKCNLKFFNYNLTKTLTFLPMFSFKKQFFIENIKVFNFFKTKNYKNYFYNKNYNIKINKNYFNDYKFDNINYNKEDENSLNLIKLNNFNFVHKNINYNLYNFNYNIYLNNLKNIYIIMVYLFIYKNIHN